MKDQRGEKNDSEAAYGSVKADELDAQNGGRRESERGDQAEGASRKAQSHEQVYDMILCGRFQVCSVLGGGMGMAYKCRDAQHTEIGFVVLKKIDESLVGRREDIEMLRKTMSAVDALRHPGIVRMYNVFKDDDTGVFYQCMAYVEGLDMEVWLANQQGMASQADLLEISRQVSNALDAIHEVGIVHCDVKPSNIIIQLQDGGMKAVLVDFSWAREIPKHGMLGSMGVVRAAGGTPRYRSPEQWVEGECTPALDQYALAVVMYEAFSGTAPFDDVDLDILREDVIQRQAPWINGLDGFVNHAFQRALAKQPSDRYASCLAFSRALSGMAPPFGKCIAGLSVAIVIVVGALLTNRPGRAGIPTAEVPKKPEAVVLDTHKADTDKPAPVKPAQIAPSRTVQVEKGQSGKSDAGKPTQVVGEKRPVGVSQEQWLEQKTSSERRLASLQEQFKGLKQNVDVSLLFSTELAEAEKEIRTLEAKREYKDYASLLERLPVVEGMVQALDTACDSKVQAQKAQVSRLHTAMADACEAISSLGASTETSRKMQPYLLELKKVLSGGDGLQSYASRTNWLKEAKASYVHFTSAVAAASNVLRSEIQAYLKLAEDEKVRVLNNGQWQNIAQMQKTVCEASPDDVQALVKASQLKLDAAKTLEQGRARKRQLRAAFTKTQNDLADALRELDESHAVQSEKLKKARNTDWEELWENGEWQKAEAMSREILATSRALLREYKAFSAVWTYVLDAQKKGEERYGIVLADVWKQWMKKYTTASELSRAGRYREAEKLAVELKASYSGMEKQRESLIARKGGELQAQWAVLRKSLEKYVPQKWLDDARYDSMNKEFQGYVENESWEDARKFLETQRRLVTHLDTYATLWSGYDASCKKAVADGAMTAQEYADQTRRIAGFVADENWSVIDEFIAVRGARLAVRSRYNAAFKNVSDARQALASKRYNTLLPAEWKKLEDNWNTQTSPLNVTEDNVEKALIGISGVNEAYTAFGKAAADCLDKRWQVFVGMQKAFDNALEYTSQQKRIGAAEVKQYKAASNSCADSWRKGEWDASEKKLTAMHRALRTIGVSNVTAQIGDKVSMVLLPLTSGEYEKSFIVSSGWWFSKEEKKVGVKISDTLWMGETEVSCAQYWTLVKEQRELYERLRDSAEWRGFVKAVTDEEIASCETGNLPVVDVTWEQASLWCELLTAVEEKNGRLPKGYEYRLPTEAEWEFAAHLGCGSSETVSEEALGSVQCDGEERQEVRSGKPNEWNFYHLPGNVREWCLDVFAAEWFNDAGQFKMYPDFGTQKRVVKGGCYDDDKEECDVTSRNSERAACYAKVIHRRTRNSVVVARMGNADETIGFRVVLARKIEASENTENAR